MGLPKNSANGTKFPADSFIKVVIDGVNSYSKSARAGITQDCVLSFTISRPNSLSLFCKFFGTYNYVEVAETYRSKLGFAIDALNRSDSISLRHIS